MNTSFLLLISLMAGISTVLGAALLFGKKTWTNKSLAIFLGLACGVMTAVVIIDILPMVLIQGIHIYTIVFFLLGMFCMWLQKKIFEGDDSRDSKFMRLGYYILFGIAWHDFPEGMAIASVEVLKAEYTWPVAFGILLHNIPEGMAIAAPLLIAKMNKIKIIIMLSLVALITPLGTLIGKLTLDSFPYLLGPQLGFAAGVMMYIVYGKLFPESSRFSRSNTVIGFLLGWMIIILATYWSSC